MTFGLLYAFSENFMLPISHDEVVHGKGSLVGKMPGDEWQRFANAPRLLRLHVGPPGQEAAVHGPGVRPDERMERDESLPWWLLDHWPHQGVQALIRDLNRLYRETPALHARDCEPEGFRWIVVNDDAQSVFAFLRRGARTIRRSPSCAISRPCRATTTASACPSPAPGARRSIPTRTATAAPTSAISAASSPRRGRRTASRFGDADAAAAGDAVLVFSPRPEESGAPDKETRSCPGSRQPRSSGISAPYSRHAMAYVLAGGRGSRLLELTDRRAKPAVYFGGKSRIIDFALSNALNSGIRRIAVATQYKAHSLIRHLQRGWNFLRPERNESFDILPASQRVSETHVVSRHRRRGLSEHRHHRELRAAVHGRAGRRSRLQDGLREDAAAARRVGRRRDGRLPRGVARGGHGLRRHARRRQNRILSFLEKPKNPPPMPGKPDVALCSMGIYVFETEVSHRAVAPRRGRPELEPRLRQGHHSLPGQERQSGRASLHPLLRRRREEAKPTGATSGRSTPIGPPTST